MKTRKPKHRSNVFMKGLIPRVFAFVVALSFIASFGLARVAQAAPYDASEFDVLTPSAETYGVTAGPDGNVWFTEYISGGNGKVGKITPSGVVTEYDSQSARPAGITSSTDGNLWFVADEDEIGKVTTSGTVTVYDIGNDGYRSGQIAGGADGNVWFVGNEIDKVGKITPSGVVTQYDIPSGGVGFGITAGPDGNMWFTAGPGKVGKITPSGVVTEYDVPNGGVAVGITTGPDDNLWYTVYGTDKIGKITTSGSITEYDVPAGAAGFAITTGSDDNLWFTGAVKDKITRITTAGVSTQYDIPTGTELWGIATGSDDNLWYSLGNDKLGRLELPPVDDGGGNNGGGNGSSEIPNNGDANNDGIQDEDQDNVSSFVNPQTGKYVSLAVDDDCTIESATMRAESSNAAQDAGYNYNYGMMDFTIDCGTPGFKTAVAQYYYGIPSNFGLVARKFKPSTNAYFSLTAAHNVSIAQTSIDNQPVVKLAYEVTDGQELDVDGQANGTIVDPVGLAQSAVGAPNTGLGSKK